MGKYKPSESAKKFFRLFKKVNDEIAGENDGFPNLSAAIMSTFDRWNKWEYNGMPEFDGDYYCYIRRSNECGTVSYYNQVCQCMMNNWILKDKETVIAWRKLLEA